MNKKFYFWSNILENQTIDFVWKIYENWNLRGNDSPERPISNRGRFIAVRVMRVEIFNYE